MTNGHLQRLMIPVEGAFLSSDQIYIRIKLKSTGKMFSSCLFLSVLNNSVVI